MTVSKTNTAKLVAVDPKCLIYGDIGVGKTTSLRTCPPGLLMLHARTLEPPPLPLRGLDVDVSTFETTEEFIGLLAEVGDCSCVAVESLTALGDLVRKETGDPEKRKDFWTIVRQRCVDLLTRIMRVQKPVICTARETSRRDPKNREEHYGAQPDIGTRPVGELSIGMFGLIVHLKRVKTVRQWRIASQEDDLAKGDVALGDALVAPPDWAMIFRKLEEYGHGTT